MTGGESPPQTQFSTSVVHVWVCKGWYIHHQTRIIPVYYIQLTITKYKEYKNNHHDFL
jgi:hypothetical protein